MFLEYDLAFDFHKNDITIRFVLTQSSDVLNLEV